MNKRGSNSFKKLQLSIEKTLAIIDRELPHLTPPDEDPTKKQAGKIVHIEKTYSLLDQCREICERFEANNKPRIRIIHQPACSGGTLISKCISALPNVYLLSEVHPKSTLHLREEIGKFAPSDLVTLGRFAGIPYFDEFAGKHFLSAISLINQHVSSYGGTVVLRDHSHSDFFVAHPPGNKGGTVATLKDTFEIQSVITVRDPIDCYLSLMNNQWIQFQPASFDEYCRRTLVFLDSYLDAEVLRYEDFVSNPKVILKLLCDAISLPYNDDFEEIFDAFTVTGDSGRSGGAIAPRKRREISQDLKREIWESAHYRKIAEKFGYPLP